MQNAIVLSPTPVADPSVKPAILVISSVTSEVTHQAGAHPGFCSMKRVGMFLLSLDRKLVHRRVIHSIKWAGTHLHTWIERVTVRVKCLAQEHNTMSPARSRTRIAGSGVERTNHVATALHV